MGTCVVDRHATESIASTKGRRTVRRRTHGSMLDARLRLGRLVLVKACGHVVLGPLAKNNGGYDKSVKGTV